MPYRSWMLTSLWVMLGAILAGCAVASAERAPATKQKSALKKQTVTAQYMLTAPVIDGKLDDAAWQDIPALPMNIPFGGLKPTADPCFVKMGWDYRNIYFGMEIQDAVIVSKERPRDGPAWEDDCFEMFMDATGRAGSYWEVAVNPNGAVYDYFIERRDGPGDPARFINATLERMRWAVHIEPQKSWSAEVSIPWRSIAVAGYFPPRPEDVWRLSVSVCDNDGPGKYTGVSLFAVEGAHKPLSYGYLQFDWTNLNKVMNEDRAAAKAALASGKICPFFIPQDLSAARLMTSSGETLILKEEMRPVRATPDSEPTMVRETAYRSRSGYGKVMLVQAAADAPGGQYLLAHPADTGSGPSGLEITYEPVLVEADIPSSNSLLTCQLWYRMDAKAAKGLQSGWCDGVGLRLFAAHADGTKKLLLDRWTRSLDWALAIADIPPGTKTLTLEVNSGPARPDADNVNVALLGAPAVQ